LVYYDEYNLTSKACNGCNVISILESFTCEQETRLVGQKQQQENEILNRLLVFGCSLTYGEGLKDCNGFQPPNPSKFAWPTFVGDALNRKVYNFGIPGASNKLIWHTILNTEIKKSDMVITLWSNPDRHCFFKDDESHTKLLPADINRNWLPWHKKAKHYYKDFYSSFDSDIDTWNRVNYINYYLNAKDIENYHFMDTSIWGGDCSFIPKWNETKVITLKFDNELKSTYDQYHPNEEAHEIFTKDMLEHIKESFTCEQETRLVGQKQQQENK